LLCLAEGESLKLFKEEIFAVGITTAVRKVVFGFAMRKAWQAAGGFSLQDSIFKQFKFY